MRDIALNCCQGKRHEEEMTLLAYYMAAVREREREHLPVIGPSVDRRALAMVHKLCRSSSVQALVCFSCAQIHTHVESWDRQFRSASVGGKVNSYAQIRRYKVRDTLFSLLVPRPGGQSADADALERARQLQIYRLNLLKACFVERFASEANGTHEPWVGASELSEQDTEWQRTLLVGGTAFGRPLPSRRDRIVCCPEDVQCPNCSHDRAEICGQCLIPLCKECHACFTHSPDVIPAGLCNDNLWGYTTEIISRYKVRWPEAAIVCPCWTSMLVFYVEGDGGHLFGEER